ncbi:MAG: cytochrome c biogenesis protein CcdA [Candidatus Caenarcaniphilales bacterium]|nr:cytochrome c biogenesis protein CcdA [Candidatus Caenarcaniphilales bacterium]
MNYFDFSSAFLEGFFLVLSPCIFSILPIVLSTSFDGGKLRPLGVISGLLLSFVIFSLAVGKIFNATGLSPQAIKLFATCFIIGFSLFMIFSSLTEKFEDLAKPFMRVGTRIMQKVNSLNLNGDFFSGLLVGGCLGLIWTPCIGPIVGLAVSQAVSQQTFLNSALIISSFCLGVAIPMSLVCFYGRTLIEKLSFMKQHTLVLKQALGTIILVSVLINSGQSISYANNLFRANLLGDKQAHLDLNHMDSTSKTFKSGCTLNT